MRGSPSLGCHTRTGRHDEDSTLFQHAVNGRQRCRFDTIGTDYVMEENTHGFIECGSRQLCAPNGGPCGRRSHDIGNRQRSGLTTPDWVGTWSASPQAVAAPIQINGQTVRQIVHTSLGGERVRVRFSNAYGTSGLVIGSAHVAISTGGASIASRTDRVLKFNGSPTITIPAGALAVSDPVALDLPALGDLAVSLYLPENVAATTQHVESQQTTYISFAGDFAGASHRGGDHDDVFLLPVRRRSPRLGTARGRS